jgi:hypothetical protein
MASRSLFSSHCCFLLLVTFVALIAPKKKMSEGHKAIRLTMPITFCRYHMIHHVSEKRQNVHFVAEMARHMLAFKGHFVLF